MTAAQESDDQSIDNPQDSPSQASAPLAGSNPADRTAWWELSDPELADQCEEDRYRASGPGGQKRNKTESAVRLRHQPTGTVVVAVESRSQHENRARAYKRLRDALALTVRQPISPSNLPAEVLQATTSGKLNLGKKNPLWRPVVAGVLDLMDHHTGRLGPVARDLGLSTAGLTEFLRADDDLWQATQQLRQKHQQRPLR